jgi:outer membrane biosynthesis protein TonB
MRAGWFVSFVGHSGAVMMTLLTAWETQPVVPPAAGLVVPVQVVNMADVSNVRALAPPQPEKEEEPPPAPETPAPAEPEPDEAPAPSPNPRQRQHDNQSDLAALQHELLLDKQRRDQPQQAEGAPSDRVQRGAGLGTEEMARLEDRVRAITRAHMRRCWREPADLPEPERLVVTVAFDLDRNGNLRGAPRVTSPTNYALDPPMRTAVDAAVRAVRLCEPYPYPDDPVVSDHYDMWRNMEYVFRPGGG